MCREPVDDDLEAELEALVAAAGGKGTASAVEHAKRRAAPRLNGQHCSSTPFIYTNVIRDVREEIVFAMSSTTATRLYWRPTAMRGV